MLFWWPEIKFCRLYDWLNGNLKSLHACILKRIFKSDSMAFTFTALADVTDNIVTWPTGPRSVTLFEVGHYFMCEWPLPQYQCCLSLPVLTAGFTTTQHDVTLSGSTPSHATPNYARISYNQNTQKVAVNCEAFTETFLWVVGYCCPRKVKRIIVKYDGRKLMYTGGVQLQSLVRPQLPSK
jgi:hypothetical protein